MSIIYNSFLLIVFYFVVSTVWAYPHPEVFPLKARGGSAYREVVLKHEKLGTLHGIMSNKTVNYFNQLIDHDNPTKGTFRQRYWIDFQFWDRSSDAPAFLYISGEGPASQSPTGFPAIVGRNVSALLMTLEHRYYGESMPAPLTDKQTLRTLHVKTVMADFANFMDHIERKVAKKLRWVSVGGSYSGALSTWLKVTFPNRFIMSWSSSGVVHPQFDYTSFDGHIVKVLPPDCLSVLRNIMTQFEKMYNDPMQRDRLYEIFKSPKYFTKSDMAWMISDGIAMSVQYGTKTQLCSHLANSGSDPIKVLANYIHKRWGQKFSSNCYYSTACLSNQSMSAQWGPAGYAWAFQCCNELAYWQVSYPNSLRSPLLTTEYFINQCRSAFFKDTFPDIFKFNKIYGGLNPKASKVIALQGSDDPWITAGIRQSLSDSYLEFTAECDDCGHCGDLGYPSVSNPVSLMKQQDFILRTVRSWVGQN